MPADQPAPSPVAEPRTLKASIQRRYVCADVRVRQIVDGAPALPAEKLTALARLLLDAANERGR